MIKSIVHKGLEDFFYDGTKKGIKPQHAQKLADILDTGLPPKTPPIKHNLTGR